MTVYFSKNARGASLLGHLYYHTRRLMRSKDISWREELGLRHHNASVVAVGGNSAGELLAPTAEALRNFNNVVLTHGNGPQVGALAKKYPHLSLSECVRLTQKLEPGQEEYKDYCVGEMLKAKVEAKIPLRKRGKQKVVIVPTDIIVDINDPAFKNPTKPVGKHYSDKELTTEVGTLENMGQGLFRAQKSEGEKLFFRKVTDAPADQPWRQVVASPKPLEIPQEQLDEIIRETQAGNIVIACGGGGVAHVRQADGTLKPVDAVIDKDLSSALLAIALKARELVISTGVARVAHYHTLERAKKSIDFYFLKDALLRLKPGNLFKTDFPFLRKTRRQVWQALRRAGYLQTKWYWFGRGKIRDTFEDELDQATFRASLREHLKQNVSDKDVDLIYDMLTIAKAGQFPAGSMGEKMEAGLNVLRRGINSFTITHPEERWIRFEGSYFSRGSDSTGRLFNAGRITANVIEWATGWRPGFLPKNELQRWLVV